MPMAKTTDHDNASMVFDSNNNNNNSTDDIWTSSGIGQYVSLPVIVLLGDTSSGKSSVLSNLIGFHLPSGSSLTTKTPVLIQIKKKKEPKKQKNKSNDATNNVIVNEGQQEEMSSKSSTTTTTAAVVDIQWRTTNMNDHSNQLKTPRANEFQQPSSPRERKREIEHQISTNGSNNTMEDPLRHQHVDETKTEMEPTITTRMTTTTQHHDKSTIPPQWKPIRITVDDSHDKNNNNNVLEQQIPEAIRKAQDTILSYRGTQIAPDVITVTVEWSALASSSANKKSIRELTLVDLPGLVQYQHQSDISLLSQVEQVVFEYVQNPRSILVPVVAAPTNIHNSKVLQWCRTVDPTTRRTIPVLTKPDLIDKGSEQDILDLLLLTKSSSSSVSSLSKIPISTTTTSTTTPNEDDTANNHHSLRTSSSSSTTQFQFYHGFYMVKNRGQAALDDGTTTIEDGLMKEHEFFATTEPWNQLFGDNDNNHNDSIGRLGIPALHTTLERMLHQLFHDCLPDIIDEMNQQRIEAESELHSWGERHETIIDQRKYYHQLVSTIVATVESSLSGKGSSSLMRGKQQQRRRRKSQQPQSQREQSNHLMMPSSPPPEKSMSGAAKLHAACSVFMKEIQKGSLATVSTLVEGCPVLVSGVSDDIKGELVHLDEENEFCCVDYVDENDHTTVDLFDGIGYKAGEHAMEKDEVWSDGSRIFISRGDVFDSLRKIPIQKIRTDPSWLEKSITRTRTENLAVFINADMFHSIVSEFVEEDWAPACLHLCDTLESILMESLSEALNEGFGPVQRYPLLLDMVEKQCKLAVSKLIENARSEVEAHLEGERFPYTQDETLLEQMKQLRLSQIRKDLETQLRLDQEGVVFDSGALNTIVDRVFTRASRRNFLAEEMEMVLSCYGKVATQRVIDRTPQICWAVTRKAAAAIESELAYVTDDRLEALLWESPEQKIQYHRLLQKVNNLRDALTKVKQVE